MSRCAIKLVLIMALILTICSPSNEVSAQTEKKLFILSDSTAASYEPSFQKEYYRFGWGMFLPDYLTGNLTLHNYSEPGCSARTYADTESYQKYLREVSAGDFVLIQFGHNDALSKYPERATYVNIPHRKLDTSGYDRKTRHYSYEWYLYYRYIQPAIEKGAYPVLITPPTRLSRNNNSNYTALAPYRTAILKLSAKYNIPLIDLGLSTDSEYQRLCSIGAGKLLRSYHGRYPDGSTDYTHFSDAGAQHLASIVAAKASKLTTNGLKQYILAARLSFSTPEFRVAVKKSKKARLNIQMTHNLRTTAAVPFTEYRSSRPSVFTVDRHGKITGRKKGSGYLSATVSIGSCQYTSYTKVTIM